MAFSNPADNFLQRELVQNGVIRNGLDGMKVNDRQGLVENLVSNHSKVSVEVWLEWLTSIRHTFRIAQVKIDPDWLSAKSFTERVRTASAEEWVHPLYESAGTILCASLNGNKETVDRWVELLGAPVMMVAPTLAELGEIRKYYSRS